MATVCESAMAKAAMLPRETQDRIGRELLAHVAKLRDLERDLDLDRGLQALDAGEGRAVDIEEAIQAARGDAGR